MNNNSTAQYFDSESIKAARKTSIIGILIAAAIALPVYALLHTNHPIICWTIIGLLALWVGIMLNSLITIKHKVQQYLLFERHWLLDHLPIQGNERIPDIGCGRGLLLIGAAQRLTTGKAIGIDIWTVDGDSPNSAEVTLRNAKIEGVLDRVEVITGDARALPFENNSFDIVVCRLTLHHIANKKDLEKAMVEIMRVLKPGGIVAIMDNSTPQEFASLFKAHGFTSVELIAPRHTFGLPTYIISKRR